MLGNNEFAFYFGRLTSKHSKSPGRVIHLVGASSCKVEGYGFHSWSRHMARLWVPSPWSAGRRQWMDVSLSQERGLNTENTNMGPCFFQSWNLSS